MAHTWKLIGLGFLGAALAAGCTVTSGDDDDSGGAAGEGGTSGAGGSTGGSSAKGGTAGSSAGKGGSSGTAGKATGGSAGTGMAGTGTAGTGGATGGSAGTGGTSDGGMAGAGDTSGVDTTPTCDPKDGELDSTPFPDCKANPSDDPCQLCIQEHCCEESKTCYGTEPYNVCGWGGPADADTYGEIGCFQQCLFDKTAANDMTCTADDADTCASDCATTMCFEGSNEFPLIGNATNDLASCMTTNCADSCFGADTCD